MTLLDAFRVFSLQDEVFEFIEVPANGIDFFSELPGGIQLKELAVEGVDELLDFLGTFPV